jgi:zinc/manganese transport system substrate-binding protein
VPGPLLRPRRLLATIALVVAVTVAAASCSGASPGGDRSGSAGGRLPVVAAENTWGSLARQLGGDHVDVLSIIDNPNTDPHDYEPTAADGRAVAQARYVIANGLGYDPWMPKLVAANGGGPRQLDVGRMLGLHLGDNPHRWYYPADVDRVIDQITSDYERLAPADASYFEARKHALETTGMATYHRRLAQIRSTYAGTPVGASESIFEGIAEATGLRLVTPSRYLTAISEGAEPTAADQATVDRQIAGRQIEVWVVNRQNATPDVRSLTAQAQRQHIPVTTITETLAPPGASFEQWQSAQLEQLQTALARAVAR